MKPASGNWVGGRAPAIRDWWAAHRTLVLRLAVVLMAVLAVLKLGDEFRRLVWEPLEVRQGAAEDLKFFHDWVNGWFGSENVFDELDPSRSAKYPPASYAILWPLVGWLDFTAARWWWALTTVGALGWLAYLMIQESGADTRLERAFVVLMLLSINSTGVTIGIGQITLHILPMLTAAMLLLRHERGGWREDLLLAPLLLATLVKPTVSAPFFWLLLVRPRWLRPALLVTLAYLALTFFAASFQEADLFSLVSSAVASGSAHASREGYANLHIWLSTLGLREPWPILASLVTLLALGVWTYRHRRVDLWLLVGVTAIVARVWTYHQIPDGVLLLLPMLALFRVAKQGPSPDGGDVIAGVLLGVTVVVMLVPARLYLWPPPWNLPHSVGQPLVWGMVLIFLIYRALWEKRRPTDRCTDSAGKAARTPVSGMSAVNRA